MDPNCWSAKGKTLNSNELAERAATDLQPLLAATAGIGPSVVNRRKRGGRSAPGNSMWISVPGGVEVTLTRSLGLSQWEGALLQPYGDALATLDGVPDQIARSAAEEVVLHAIAAQLGGAAAGDVVERAIRFLLRRANETYEGQAVHLNLLLDLAAQPATVAPLMLEDLEQYDWHALLGSGIDTGIAIDQTGGVTGIRDVRIPQGAVAPALLLHPDVFRHIAEWSAQSGGVALSLSRTRELVLHQAGRFRYIFRAGKWRALPLDVAVDSGWSTGSSISKALKREVLASAIDASLGHHGASLAVVVRGRKLDFAAAGIIQPTDLWPANVRSKLFGSDRFQQLTRRQRLEILSMDGATVLDHTGKILTAGAIVAVPAGSTGGGRLAATRALAEFGAALKVSQDGPISLFGRDAQAHVVQKLSLA